MTELEKLKYENEQLRKIAEPILTVARGYLAEKNDITHAPFWAIVRKTKKGNLIFEAGPWFSRERAENYLEAKRGDYPKSFVHCFSGHYNKGYTKAIEAAIVFEGEDTKDDALAFVRTEGIKLHPCGRCKGLAETQSPSPGVVIVRCQDCGTRLSRHTITDAVVSWNKHNQPLPSDKEIKNNE